MGAFVCKQPNGLYCRFSSVVDCPTHWNMTAEEYIEMCINKATKNAKQEAASVLEKYLQDFEKIKESFIPNNMTQEEFDKIVELMSEPVNNNKEDN